MLYHELMQLGNSEPFSHQSDPVTVVIQQAKSPAALTLIAQIRIEL